MDTQQIKATKMVTKYIRSNSLSFTLGSEIIVRRLKTSDRIPREQDLGVLGRFHLFVILGLAVVVTTALPLTLVVH